MWFVRARVEIYQQASFTKAQIVATVQQEEKGSRVYVALRGQCILTGGEVISGGVDMSPKSSNWVTACKDKEKIMSPGKWMLVDLL